MTRANSEAVRAMAAELDRGELVTERRSRHGVVPLRPEARPPETPPHDDRDRVLLALVEILEQRIDNRAWHAQAACRGRPAWLWFPARGDAETLERAKRVCGACTVRTECLAAHAEERSGVWGGLSAAERRALREQAA